MTNTTPVLQLQGITKRFPGVVANDRVTFDVGAGEIHAVVGENGAGKSTLMKIVTGLYPPDEGCIIFKGRPVAFRSPGQAIAAGIGIVHQHFMLVDAFTVAENVILGAEPARLGVIDPKTSVRQVSELCDRFGLKVDPAARVEDISVGEQQRVEILKVLYRGAEVIILDEPTAVLVPQEVEELFEHLMALKGQGKTVIFISHKLDEVLRVADVITVLRQGRVVGTVPAAEVTRERLAEMMVGRPVLFDLKRGPAAPGGVVLSVEGLTSVNGSRAVLDDLSLEVRAGEIYGLAGVEGNGQTELAEAIMGLRPVTGGRVTLLGEDVTNLSTGEVRRRRVAYIPEDRHRRGLVLPMTVWENVILGVHRSPEFSRGGRLLFRSILSSTEEAVRRFDVRLASVLAPAQTLSGGNQQKLILAREFRGDPGFILASQPTRGLDIGATEFVRQELLNARDRGAAVLLISADLEEVLSISDRIGVIYNGHIQAEFGRDEADPRTLGAYMTGARTARREGGSVAS
ncbi:MAG TPA: ABC transporter ATP-binding protein [Clostridiales bacterium]|nr:ABC transporter ATP-binding protein [Clostridiales bacterium]